MLNELWLTEPSQFPTRFPTVFLTFWWKVMAEVGDQSCVLVGANLGKVRDFKIRILGIGK